MYTIVAGGISICFWGYCFYLYKKHNKKDG